MVAYWHWHSIHNSAETYWKGLLSHDFKPNPVYNEAKTIGADFARLSNELINLRKSNQVAVMVSNEALTAMEWFKLPDGKTYNDVVRALYDELYKLNVEVDFIQPTHTNLNDYKLIVVPALYAAADECLLRLNEFVRSGGHVVYSFKSGFADEAVKVRAAQQPGIIHEACGITYSMFVSPNHVSLKGELVLEGTESSRVEAWMELITPTTAEVLAYYDHSHWGEYAAITRNKFGRGTATYIGCLPGADIVRRVMSGALQDAGLWGVNQELSFPIIVKSGLNANGEQIRYYFNYSNDPAAFNYSHQAGTELLTGSSIASGQQLELAPWGLLIIKE